MPGRRVHGEAEGCPALLTPKARRPHRALPEAASHELLEVNLAEVFLAAVAVLEDGVAVFDLAADGPDREWVGSHARRVAPGPGAVQPVRILNGPVRESPRATFVLRPPPKRPFLARETRLSH